MRVLVIGSGGREHTLCWKITQSKLVDKVYCAPGNAGTALLAENVNIKADDIKALLKFSKDNKIDLTCVGPEVPLVSGIVDVFTENGMKIFGPSKGAALLEGSKIYAKEIMKKYGVPTADFKVFDDEKKAKAYVKEKGAPIVIKADGLAAGKGVTVCSSIEEAIEAIDTAMVKKAFGDGGKKILIEEAISGEEASILIISDGENNVILDSSQDHKRIFDRDQGPNTGGMGAYSPAPVVTKEIFDKIIDEVITPVIKGMEKEGNPFKGVLYAGVMFTEDGPKVLEFNVRFGDPETQAILPRMKSDLVSIMLASISGDLGGKVAEWDKRSCVSVVLASGGYPGSYEKGKVIKGLEYFDEKRDTFVFHAGTIKNDGNILTNGGRVLNVVGLGKTIKEAIDTTYLSCKKVKFENMHYRRDIGHRALNRTVLSA